jgi:hypothetical protein
MPSPSQISSPKRRRHRRKQTRKPPEIYGIGDLAGAYLIALLINVGCLVLVMPLELIIYPLTGIVMSRYLGRRIIWSKLLGTIENIASAKLGFILTWPLAMPAFLWKLAVVKYF